MKVKWPESDEFYDVVAHNLCKPEHACIISQNKAKYVATR